LKMAAFWNIVPCNLVDVNGRFRGAYCLHHQSSSLFINIAADGRMIGLLASPMRITDSTHPIHLDS
jgi:hypothetical protein